MTGNGGDGGNGITQRRRETETLWFGTGDRRSPLLRFSVFSRCLRHLRYRLETRSGGAGTVNPRQFPREIRGRHLPTSAGILSRPQRREIIAAPALRLRAQRSECRRRQRKVGNRRADWSKLSHQAVHDASGGPAAEEIG